MNQLLPNTFNKHGLLSEEAPLLVLSPFSVGVKQPQQQQKKKKKKKKTGNGRFIGQERLINPLTTSDENS